MIFYHPGKNERSLSAKDSFDSLIFYYDLTLDPGDFYFILVVSGGWFPTFLVFNFLHINNIYIDEL